MGPTGEFLHIFSEFGIGLLDLWYITVPLALAAAVTLFVTKAHVALREDRSNWCFLAPLAIPTIALLLGALFPDQPKPSGDYLLGFIAILFLAQLPLCGVVLWKVREIWPFALAIHLNVIWWSVLSNFIAYFSIATGPF